MSNIKKGPFGASDARRSHEIKSLTDSIPHEQKIGQICDGDLATSDRTISEARGMIKILELAVKFG